MTTDRGVITLPSFFLMTVVCSSGRATARESAPSPRAPDPRICPGPLPTGRTASGGALVPQPAYFTGIGPEFPQIVASPISPFLNTFFEFGLLLFLKSDFNSSSMSDFIVRFQIRRLLVDCGGRLFLDRTSPQDAGRTRPI